jgi:hypothetical protein
MPGDAESSSHASRNLVRRFRKPISALRANCHLRISARGLGTVEAAGGDIAGICDEATRSACCSLSSACS